jgi:chromosome segregation ATPase
LQVQAKEGEVESSIKTRDELNCSLDRLEESIIEAKEQMMAKKRAVEDAERCRKATQAALEQAHSELGDLTRERDEAKSVADAIYSERIMLNDAITNTSNELKDIIKNNEAAVNELIAIRKENSEISGTNDEMNKALASKRQEHQQVLEKRSKMAKLRELIEHKCNETEQERKALEKEKNRIHIDTVQLELELNCTSNEAIRRVIKRLQMELEVVNRKTDLAKRGSHALEDLVNSHQNTLKVQGNEISGKA